MTQPVFSVAKVIPRIKRRVKEIVLANLTISLSQKVLKKWAELIVAFKKMLRDHLNLRNYRHKVGISLPTWNHVPVEMVFHPGPGRASQIHSEINTAGLKHLEDYINRGSQGIA